MLSSRASSVAFFALLTLFLVFYFFANVRSVISERVTHLPNAREDTLLRDVVNRTLGFQNIFVLGLRSRTDHRDAVELAAAATGLQVDWIDGVTAVEDKAIPGREGTKIGKEGIGSWRAHMNALQTIVRDDISSALILEDDADWDLRIKQQMHDFALSTRALTQPLLSDVSSFADPTYPVVGSGDEQLPAFTIGDLPRTRTPKLNPYGDNWDVLWLGHCGIKRPGAGDESAWPVPPQAISRGHVVHSDDPTVPEPHHLHDFKGTFGANERSGNAAFQNHTRTVHHAQDGFCSVAYAVSQQGARKMLWYMGVRAFDAWFDTMLPNFCGGKDLEGLDRPTCIAVQPTLFDQHNPRGESWKESDIFSTPGQGFRAVPETYNIRWSTRINLPKLLSGKTDYTDQWPDSG